MSSEAVVTQPESKPATSGVDRARPEVSALNNYVMPIFHVMRRELGAYFNTAIGYVFLVMFTLVVRALYLKDLFLNGEADMRYFFGSLPFLFLIYIPAISMRLWAEERKIGTLELLLTFPVRAWQTVLGKFLAGLAFVTITLLLTTDIPAALYWLRGTGPGPDFGPIMGGYLGALMLAMIYLSAGAFASSLTSDQIVAFVYGISIGFVLYFAGQPDFIAFLKELDPRLPEVVQQFGVIYHFDSICRGVVDSRDVLYAVSVTMMFLFFNVLVVERRR